QVAGAVTGVWLGMLGSLVLFVGLAVAETVAAGYALRHGGRLPAVLFPYLEVTLAGLATGAAAFQALSALGSPDEGLIRVAGQTGLSALLTALAVVGMIYRWPGLLLILAYS